MPPNPATTHLTTHKTPFRRLFYPGDSWFDADTFTLDGVSGKVTGFVDHMDATHVLAQGTGSAQVAAPSSVAAFGGARGAQFLGAQYYLSNRPASAWTFLTSQANTVIYVESPSAMSGSEVRGGSRINVVGLTVYRSATSLHYYYQPSAGAVLQADTTPPYADGVSRVTGAVVAADGTVRTYMRNAFSTSATVAIAANTPQSPFSLGASGDGSLGMRCWWRAVCMFKRALTLAEMQVAQAYFLATANAT